MPSLVKYRVYCTNDSKYEYVWKDESEAVPTACPANTAHSIDSAQTSIILIQKDDEVSVKDEETLTEGKYQVKSFKLAIPGSTGWHGDDASFDITFPFPISLMSGIVLPEAANSGDEAKFHVAPDKVYGTATAVVSIGATVIDVSQDVIDNVGVSYKVKITDGTETDDLGRVISVDKDSLKITVETATTHAFVSTDTIKATYEMAPLIHIVNSHKVALGENIIKGRYVPANTILRPLYNNVDGVAKDFIFMLQYKV